MQQSISNNNVAATGQRLKICNKIIIIRSQQLSGATTKRSAAKLIISVLIKLGAHQHSILTLKRFSFYKRADWNRFKITHKAANTSRVWKVRGKNNTRNTKHNRSRQRPRTEFRRIYLLPSTSRKIKFTHKVKTGFLF